MSATASKDPEIAPLKERVVVLTPYAVEMRYPETGEPSKESAEEAVQLADEVKRYILKRIGR